MRALSILIAAACSAASWAIPSVLIVPISDKPGAERVEALADYLAQEFDGAGKVGPIVWGMTDPTFRVAVLEGRLRSIPEAPNAAQAVAAAQQINAEYVLTYTATIEKGKLKAKGELRRGGRSIWKHEDNLGVTLGDAFAREDTGKSLARTWAMMLHGGPWKDLPPRPKTQTPEAGPGQRPVQVPVTGDTMPIPPEPDPTAITRLRDEVASLMVRDPARAVATARAAVDDFPLQVERRSLLIDALIASTDFRGAAEEARRAAMLMPSEISLRLLAARAWMSADQPDEAWQDLNEAVARDPDAAGTRLLLAEISLRKGEAEKAVGHLDHVLKSGANRDALLLRAVCRSLLGGAEGVAKDLAELAATPERSPEEVRGHYVRAMEILERAMEQEAVDARDLFRLVALRRTDPAIAETLERMAHINRSRLALLEGIAIPPTFSKSHDRRLLALKLLAQVYAGVESYLKSGAEDEHSDAQINLGEALKHWTAAREAFRTERDEKHGRTAQS